MNQRVHANIDESRFSQHARHPRADGPVDPVHLRVGVENLQKTRLGGEGGIASLSRRVRLMQGDDTTWPDKPDHLRNELLWFWHVDEDQARRREVERSLGKTCAASIGMKDCRRSSSDCRRRTAEPAPLARHSVPHRLPCLWHRRARREDRDNPAGHSRSRRLANRHQRRSGQTTTLIHGQVRRLVAPDVPVLLGGSPASTDQVRSFLTFQKPVRSRSTSCVTPARLASQLSLHTALATSTARVFCLRARPFRFTRRRPVRDYQTLAAHGQITYRRHAVRRASGKVRSRAGCGPVRRLLIGMDRGDGKCSKPSRSS